MNYVKIYEAFISDRLANKNGKVLFKTKKASKKHFKGYCEMHHIIPKCKGGSDDLNNLILLSASDHIFAHMLLSKIYPGTLVYALRRLISGVTKNNSGLPNKVIRKAYNFIRSNPQTDRVIWNKGLKTPKELVEKQILRMSKEVMQFDINGSLLAIYKNSLIAEELTGVKSSLIRLVCNGKRKATGGYLWVRSADYNGTMVDGRNPKRVVESRLLKNKGLIK